MGAPQETIDGRTFSFGMMPAETSFLISLRIIKQLGEAGFRLLIEFASQEANLQSLTLAQVLSMFAAKTQESEGAMQGIKTAIATMDPVEYLAIVKTIFESVAAEKTPGAGASSFARLNEIFNTVFLGKPKLVWRVLLPALRENYRDLFAGGGSPSDPLPQS